MEGFNMGKESIHSAYVHFVGETLFFYLRKESSFVNLRRFSLFFECISGL